MAKRKGFRRARLTRNPALAARMAGTLMGTMVTGNNLVGNSVTVDTRATEMGELINERGREGK
ncbi:MAG: hypothetical protein ACM3TT_04970 [Syntrophothermus sp.]